MSAPRRLRYSAESMLALGANPLHKIAARQALVHYPSGSIYSFIPKNGCTTMRLSLAMAHGCISSLDDWHWIHNNNDTFAATLSELVRAPFTFTILRCPHRRLASAFFDKIVGRGPNYNNLHKVKLRSFDHTILTFRQFVTMLTDPKTLRLDIHWRPQADMLVYEDYDAWLTMERFDDAVRVIGERTGLEVIDARPLRDASTIGLEQMPPGLYADMPIAELERARDGGQLPRVEDLYDDELAATVSRLYASDTALYSKHCDPADLMFPEARAV
ncbi:sulfotransferase family 2 domain-containing protein [Pseudoroseicyclus sp. H15]